LLAKVAHQAAIHELSREAIFYWTGQWLYSKSADWSYEQEWRAVIPGPGFWSFPEHALTGVIIGCAVQDDDLAALRDTLQRRPPVPLYKAVRKQGVYGVDIVRVDIESLIGVKRKRRAVELITELNDANAENDIARRDASLNLLRALARDHSSDAAVRQQLAIGLFNTVNDARAKGDLARRNALLDELRALADTHPRDTAVHEQRDSALFYALVGGGPGLSSWKALKL
jgi:hypothetical protein